MTTRLFDARSFWSDSLAAYQDPSLFRRNLNSCIQELRNVTFLLQKQKQAFEDFDSWYKPWVQRMSSDSVINWVKNARNKIVKEGDLNARSTARVSSILSYSESAHMDLEVSPFLTADEIATTVLHKAKLPNAWRSVAVVRIERRWVVEDLPDWELLEALGHAWGVLSRLVMDAVSKYWHFRKEIT